MPSSLLSVLCQLQTLTKCLCGMVAIVLRESSVETCTIAVSVVLTEPKVRLGSPRLDRLVGYYMLDSGRAGKFPSLGMYRYFFLWQELCDRMLGCLCFHFISFSLVCNV